METEEKQKLEEEAEEERKIEEEENIEDVDIGEEEIKYQGKGLGSLIRNKKGELLSQ